MLTINELCNRVYHGRRVLSVEGFVDFEALRVVVNPADEAALTAEWTALSENLPTFQVLGPIGAPRPTVLGVPIVSDESLAPYEIKFRLERPI